MTASIGELNKKVNQSLDEMKKTMELTVLKHVCQSITRRDTLSKAVLTTDLQIMTLQAIYKELQADNIHMKSTDFVSHLQRASRH